jgi:hypothetical protein
MQAKTPDAKQGSGVFAFFQPGAANFQSEAVSFHQRGAASSGALLEWHRVLIEIALHPL